VTSAEQAGEKTAKEELMTHHSRDGGRITRRDETGSVPKSGWTSGHIVVGAGVLALVVCVANFALGEVGAGIAAAIVGLMAFGAGLDWIGMDRRRIRQAEREWFNTHRAC
jgi:hypothetical protein